MIRITVYVFSCLALALVNASSSVAATVTFDFGNANTVNNSQNGGDGNWTPFANETTSISTTAAKVIDGLEMTINGAASDGNAVSDEYWGINNQGLGVITDDTTNSLPNARDRRIDGTIGESISFSFDQDVTLSSVRLGSFNGVLGATETVTITPDGGAAIAISTDLSTPAPTDDWPLGDVLVLAGTPVTLTTTAPLDNGVLFNEITVNVVPEPGSMLLLGTALVFIALRLRKQRRPSQRR